MFCLSALTGFSFLEKGLELFPVNPLLFQEQGSTGMEDIHVICENPPGILIAGIDDPLHFIINLAGDLFTEAPGMTQVPAQENLIGAFFVIQKAQLLGHAILDDHGPGRLGHLFDVLGCAGCDVVKN